VGVCRERNGISWGNAAYGSLRRVVEMRGSQ
jgi:hypothetical protein